MDSSKNETTPPEPRRAEMDGWSRPLPEKLPRPTYWPFFLALGIMLIAMGVVTNFAVSMVGFILLVAAMAGWIGELQYGE